jgi:hypothetical protein
LPKREHDAPAWLAAIQALMLVVEHGGDTMLPRIGIMRALYPDGTEPTQRKKREGSIGSSGNRAEVIPLIGRKTRAARSTQARHPRS